ncbi:MAG: hypothetical protein HFE39_05350 [Clostridiales bacterium]|nr:hypothetical protein [Clostridiales bacterium]
MEATVTETHNDTARSMVHLLPLFIPKGRKAIRLCIEEIAFSPFFRYQKNQRREFKNAGITGRNTYAQSQFISSRKTLEILIKM